jgi:hypothetical protein
MYSVPVAIQFTSIVMLMASTPYTALPNILTNILTPKYQIRIKYAEKSSVFTYGKTFAILGLKESYETV